MTRSDAVSYLVQSLSLVLWLSLPPILVASVIGLLFALFQALTQLQEQTVAFAVKLVAVCVTLALTGHWMGESLHRYTVSVFSAISGVP